MDINNKWELETIRGGNEVWM